MSASMADNVQLSRHAGPRKLGLKQVFPDGGQDSSGTDVDLIAIHGLDTQSPRTWVSWKEDGDPTSGQVHWLQDRNMLPSVIPNARIFTYDWNANFDYNPSADILLGHADALLDRLHIHRSKDSNNRPIIFVASCFGGLLLVKALHRALEIREYQGILKSTVGIAFLGTPFQGSHESFYTATHLRMAVAIRMGGEGSDELLKYLRNDAGGRGELDELVQRFCEMVADDELKFPIVCFYETQRTDFTKVIRDLPPEFAKQLDSDNTGILVPRHSACLQGPRRFGLDVRHALLNKYPRPDDDAFMRVSFRLKEFVTDAQKILQAKSSRRQEGHWLVPFGRNKHFVGREPILAQLLERIPPSRDNDDCQRTAIEGLGGVGKTQVALEAAFKLRDKHPDCSVFWVPAMDPTAFENAYREIGRCLGIAGIDEDKADVKTLVKAALSHEDTGRWLLIIDNADDAELFFGSTSLSDYLPFSRMGSILFTTRNHEAAVGLDIPVQGIITTTEMSGTEAIELLQKSLKESQTGDATSTTNLLEFLANLPLAIKQASAYMAKTGMTTARYLEHCRSSDKTMISLLSKDFEDRGRYRGVRNPITTTWLISFEHISRDSQLAIDYLKFMSFLAEKDIPKNLLPPGNDELEADEAIGTLRAYAFVTERPDRQSYDMHRLVRLAMRNWLVEEGEVKIWATYMMRRLAQMFPFPNHENRPIWARYLPHVLTTLEFREDSTDKLAELDILHNTAGSYFILGKYEEEVQKYRQALELNEKMLGKKHRNTLGNMYNLAHALTRQQTYQEADQMHRQTLELRMAVLGREHPDTLASMNAIAMIHERTGEHEEAEQMLRQTFELNKAILGEEHPSTLASMNNLAVTLSRQGKDADEIHRRSFELTEKVLGKEHPETFASMNNLAYVLRKQGKYEEAEQIYRRIVELNEKVSGMEHPSTVRSRKILARFLRRRDGEINRESEMGK